MATVETKMVFTNEGLDQMFQNIMKFFQQLEGMKISPFENMITDLDKLSQKSGNIPKDIQAALPSDIKGLDKMLDRIKKEQAKLEKIKSGLFAEADKRMTARIESELTGYVESIRKVGDELKELHDEIGRYQTIRGEHLEKFEELMGGKGGGAKGKAKREKEAEQHFTKATEAEDYITQLQKELDIKKQEENRLLDEHFAARTKIGEEEMSRKASEEQRIKGEQKDLGKYERLIGQQK